MNRIINTPVERINNFLLLNRILFNSGILTKNAMNKKYSVNTKYKLMQKQSENKRDFVEKFLFIKYINKDKIIVIEGV